MKKVKKMQAGGKIKIKIKPDRKQAREDKDKLPLMKNPREAEMKSKKSNLDKSVKDAGFKKGGVVKAQNGIATADSTSYFKDKGKRFAQLSKSEKGNTEVSKFNKRFFENEQGKAAGDQLRQGYKGKTGYDKNGNPVKKKMMKSGGKMAKCKYGCK
jgi:hypothetical protein